VLVFSTSGTYRAAPGVVTDVVDSGIWVQLEGERLPLAFRRREIVPLEESAPGVGGAE
jgi:hypothetical protein